MIPVTQTAPEVFVADGAPVQVDRDSVQFLVRGAGASARQRIRLCAHRGTEDRLHEMFIAFTDAGYLRPSLHLKDEALHVLEGQGTYLFFDDHGAITRAVPLGPYGSRRSFYCRIPQGVYHALVVESPVMLIHEITSGPFQREDTVFAPWAPDESDQGARAYASWLRDKAVELSEAALA